MKRPEEPVIHRGWLLGVLLIGPFMAQADATIVNVATPSIHASLGGSGAALQLVVGGYLIALAVLLITGARLGQAYGYRRAFLAGVCVFSLASLAAALAPSPVVLVVARVVQSAGAAVMFPQTLTGIQLHFTGPDRARAIARYAMALSAGAVSGQILGGLLVSANVAGLGWRAVFVVNIPVGLAAMIAALRFLPADDRRQSRLDLAGVGLLSASILLLVIPLTLGRSAGWPDWAWACLVASLPVAAAFAAVERLIAARGGAPLLNIGLLAVPVVRWGLAALAIATSTYYALMFTLAQYLQIGLGWSAVASGLTLVPWVAAFGLAGYVVRHLPDSRWLPAGGCLLLAAAFGGIAAGLLAGQHGVALLAPLFGIGGLGLGIQFAVLAGRMTAAVPSRYASDISGVSSTVIQIGGSIGVAAIGALYLSQARGVSQAHHAAHAFAVTALALCGLALTASISAYRATHSLRSETSEPLAPVRTDPGLVRR
ncbi:MAG TPA: MFS transporter [Streptosporangiaceae bacterium]